MSTHRSTSWTELETYVSKRASSLQKGYLANTPVAVATLAKLRRGIGRSPGDDIELLEFATAGLEPDAPWIEDAPTPRERAAFAAITLFALHQQSQRSRRMHREGYSFGRSARLLRKHLGGDDNQTVRRRFNAIGTAVDRAEIVHHARGLIQQFRAEDIPLDYGRFAVDLLALERGGEAARAVRNAWGRDFYRASSRDDEDDVEPDADTAASSPAAADPITED